MQLARHLHFFMGSAEAFEVNVAAMEEKATDAEKELSEAKIWAFEIEGEF